MKLRQKRLLLYYIYFVCVCVCERVLWEEKRYLEFYEKRTLGALELVFRPARQTSLSYGFGVVYDLFADGFQSSQKFSRARAKFAFLSGKQ